MRIGVPREIKNHEYRVGLTPASVQELVGHGHVVLVESGAGDAIGYDDASYRQAGAQLVACEQVFSDSDLIVKVKEPQAEERQRLRPGQTLFTYLHLAAEETLTLALGALLGRQLHQLPEMRSIDLVINTPTHWKRRLQRGISSTELLLTGILSQLNLPHASGLLRCTRSTGKQGMLSASQRQRNVSKAFRITVPHRIRDQHLLVVDDVMTSGATLNEIARILHRAGARRISNVVLARGYSLS
mgnify:CR=1 FL=1